MLDQPYEAPPGSNGASLGPLRVEVGIRANRHFRIGVDRAGTIAIASLKGVPLARPQSGSTVGVRWDP